MATLTRSTTASMDTSTGELAPQFTGTAGEDLDLVAPCYIKTSDGKIYMSNGTAATEPAEFVGFTPRAVKSGQPVTLFSLGARFKYGSSLSPGAKLYVSATAGRLDDAATTGGTVPVAIVLPPAEGGTGGTDILCVLAAA